MSACRRASVRLVVRPTSFPSNLLFWPLSDQNSRLRRRAESLEQSLNAQLADAREKLKQAEEKIKAQLADLEHNSAAKVEEIQLDAKKEIEDLKERMETERKVRKIGEAS